MQANNSLEANSIVHNRYRIVRIIGQGGMGAVYESIDQRLGNKVALKQMIVSGAQYSIAFEREARLLAALRHPSLPKVTDFFIEGDQQFLVMEFIPGADLAALRKQRGQPFAVEEVLRWGEEVLLALEFLHSQKPPIIHRDIKPQNLKVTPEGTIVLLDFGLAKGSATAFSQVATTNSIFGYTPMYAPLEQIQGTGTSAASDLYSLAATLHHLLTDTLPVDVLARAGALLAGKPDPLRPANELNPMVTPAIGAWLVRGLQPDQNQRYASAAEMRAALRQIQGQAPAVPLPPTVMAAPAGAPPTVAMPAPQPYAQPQASQPYGQQPISQPYGQPISQPYGQSYGPPQRSTLPWIVAAIGGLALLALIAVVALLVLRSPTQTAIAPTTQIAANPTSGGDEQLIADNVTSNAATEPPPAPTPPPAPPTEVPPTPTPSVEPTPEVQFGPLQAQRPVRVSASNSAPPNQDSSGSTVSYGPENATDGAEDTAWRVAGAGINQYMQLDFAGPVRVREILVLPGYAKTDPFDGTDRFKQNRRVSRVRLEFSDGSSVEAQFADARQLQLIPVNPVVTTSVRIVILETTAPAPNNGRDFTPISEVVVRGEAQQ